MVIHKIVAIGGGEIGREGYQVETLAIDKEIIRLSGKKHPRLLFLPTASNDSDTYIAAARKHFMGRLGCDFGTLCLVKEASPKRIIEKKIREADIIYVGGGNTMKMMQIWRRYGVDKLLYQAYNQGKVMSGLSAGAICWFKYGLSDSRVFQKGKSKAYMRVRGLSFVNLTVSPHHIRETMRKAGLIALMKKIPGVGIALDDYSALEIIGNKFRILSVKSYAGASRVYLQKGRVYYQLIRKSAKLEPLTELFSKQ